MKSVLRFTPFLLFLFLVSRSSFAQTTSVTVSAVSGPRLSTFSMHVPLQSGPPVVGSPVSYERVSESSRFLADGTRITDKTFITYFYRDSFGRTRTERPLLFGGLSPSPEPAITVIEIHDHVVGVQYVFDSQNRIAYRLPITVRQPQKRSVAVSLGNSSLQIKAADPAQSPAFQQNDPLRPQYTTESLGTDVMEGVSVEGHRMTTVYPIGSVGNDRPISATSEYWYSADLGETVLSKSSSLLNGDQTTRLINVSRAEPDPALFQVPAGYQIVDGPADGHVTFKFELPPR